MIFVVKTGIVDTVGAVVVATTVKSEAQALKTPIQMTSVAKEMLLQYFKAEN